MIKQYIKWIAKNIESKEWYETDIATLDSLPATKEEYEQYLKTKQP